MTHHLNFSGLGRVAGLLLLALVPGYAQASNVPSIAEFVNEATAEHPLVVESQARVEAARELELAAARPRDNPEIELEAEEGEESVFAVGIAKTFDLSGERSAHESIARHKRLASEAELEQARRSVAIELLQGLSAYQSAQAKLELSERRMQVMSEFSRLAERRHMTGDLSLIEMDLAVLAKAHSRMNHATIAVSLAEAREQLRSQTTPRQSEADWPKLDMQHSEINADAVSEALVLELPEVRAAKHRAESVAAVAELRRRERRPNPRVGVLAGREGEESLVALNFSLELPVLRTGRHEVLAAESDIEAARAVSDKVIRRARARAASSAQVYRETLAAWNEWTDLGRISLDRKADILKRLWNVGEISTSEYLLQLEHVLDLELRAVELEEALFAAWLDWLMASGRVSSWVAEIK